MRPVVIALFLLTLASSLWAPRGVCGELCAKDDEHRRRLFTSLDLSRGDLREVRQAVAKRAWPEACRALLVHYRTNSPEEYRAMIAAMLVEIEKEAAAEREGRPVLGVEKILAQHPCQRLGKSKKSPAPMLIFADRPEVREAMSNDYKDFADAYEIGAQRLIEAAAQGYRLDPRRHLPDGSFAPSVIEAILSRAAGFNPEAEFPGRSFPRSWPFIGGKLAPPPLDPPSRPLVYDTIDGKPTIVWRGEIPTVHVPRRLDPAPQEDLPTPPTTNISPKEVQPASRDPARDPP